jgi:hypothetical protein
VCVLDFEATCIEADQAFPNEIIEMQVAFFLLTSAQILLILQEPFSNREDRDAGSLGVLTSASSCPMVTVCVVDAYHVRVPQHRPLGTRQD